MKKTVSALLLAIIMITALYGCADNNSDTLFVYAGEGVASLDPLRCDSKAGQTYIANLYSGLYSYSYGEDGLPVLTCEDAQDLPTVRETENGMYELTFKLKEGLTWSNGEPLTPEDYVYSWNRAAKYFAYSDKSYLFSLIDGYESFVEYDEDASLNMSYDNSARTFTVTLTEDSEQFLSYTTETALFPVSRVAVRDSDEWATLPEDFASNGRYKLEELSKRSLVIVKNPNFRDADSALAEKIEFLFDIDEAEKLYENGKLTFAKLIEDTSLMLHKTAETACASGYIAFNANDSALGLYTEEEKAKIRKAVGIYIASSDAFGEKDKKEPSLVPMLKRESLAHKMTESDADALLSEVALSSGRFTYQDGKVYEFPILTAISAGRDTERKNWSAVADCLAEQGINLQVTNCTWEEFLLASMDGDYSMMFNVWSYNNLSAGEMLSLFRSDSAYNNTLAGTVEGGIDWSVYDGSVLVKISDIEKANESYMKAHSLLEESALVLPVLNVRVDFYSCDALKYTLSLDGLVRLYK